jgi:hypothetical protein
MQNFSSNIAEDQAKIEGTINPERTANELIGGTAYDAIPFGPRWKLAEDILGEANRRARQAAEDADKAAKEQAETVTAQDVDLARDGKLPLTVLQQHLKDYNLNATQYDVIRNFIEKAPTTPSNRVTLDDMTLQVRSAFPPPNLKGQLGQLFTDHNTNPAVGLNREDYMQLDTELTANLRHAQEQGRSDARYRHGQAEQQIDAAFGLSGIDALIGKFGDDVKQPRALAQQYLFQHSIATGGREEPLTLVPKILKTYLPLAQTAMKARILTNTNLVPASFRVVDSHGNLSVAESAARLGTVEQAASHGLTKDQWAAATSALQDLANFQGVLGTMTSITDGITVTPEGK